MTLSYRQEEISCLNSLKLEMKIGVTGSLFTFFFCAENVRERISVGKRTDVPTLSQKLRPCSFNQTLPAVSEDGRMTNDNGASVSASYIELQFHRATAEGLVSV